MRPIIKTVGALGVAGVLALASTAPSSADDRWAYAAGGFAAGALLGSAIASSSTGYYAGSPYGAYAYEPTYVGPTYAYSSGPVFVDSYAAAPAYDSFAYVPRRTVVAPGYDSYAYAPGPTYVAPRRSFRCYNSRDCLSPRERQLQGTDY
jgi:hypothetical protein